MSLLEEYIVLKDGCQLSVHTGLTTAFRVLVYRVEASSQ
jgi:hypothetical protein